MGAQNYRQYLIGQRDAPFVFVPPFSMNGYYRPAQPQILT